MGLWSWLWAKLEMPAYQAAAARRYQAWDYGQCNDWAIRDGDPARDQVTQAARLLDDDPEPAFFELLTLAHQGSAWSMLNVGWCYEVGCGVPASSSEAEHWYRRAHEAGCERATLSYTRVLRGRDARDLELEAYAPGIARGWAPVLYRAARLLLSEAETLAARLLHKPLLDRAAELGSPAAQRLQSAYMLGGRFGWRFIPRGVRLFIAFTSARLAELDAEDAKDSKTPSRPADVTLH